MRLGRAVATALCTGQEATLRRGVVVLCDGCGDKAIGAAVTRISRQGIWSALTDLPEGWGARFARTETGAIRKHYCALCSAKITHGRAA